MIVIAFIATIGKVIVIVAVESVAAAVAVTIATVVLTAWKGCAWRKHGDGFA
jgi:hypothetical protein